MDMATLLELNEEQLEKDLAEIGIPVGARRKIAKGLKESAHAAAKAAAIEEANDQAMAAAAQLQRDEERIKKQREEIARLQDVIAARSTPQEIICPITHEITVDPVVAADGHTYEHCAIASWLSKNNTSPLTGAILKHTELTSNHAIRVIVQRFIDDCTAAGTDPNQLL